MLGTAAAPYTLGHRRAVTRARCARTAACVSGAGCHALPWHMASSLLYGSMHARPRLLVELVAAVHVPLRPNCNPYGMCMSR
jgi:hypothetical protein